MPMKNLLFFAFIFSTFLSFSQKTKVEGIVLDTLTGEPLPFVTVRFQGTKTGTFTDTNGYYLLDSYYTSDTLVFSLSGYLTVKKHVQQEQNQTINITLPILVSEYGEVTVRAPDELPSTRLHKKVVANKKINNKEKLEAYSYEVYNKAQLDLNNIGDKFKKNKTVSNFKFILDYLDSTDTNNTYLPVILSESISDFYFQKTPKKRKEIIKASRITGIDNLELNQFMGDMYLDVNIYDNHINIFNKSFISPTSYNARSFYKFYLEDSTFIGSDWCYKLRFAPKRKGDLTFIGEMWIHDTTYAVKSFQGRISESANINYVQQLYLEQNFEQVETEVWMMTEERMFVDLNFTKNTKLNGFYGRKYSSRSNFVINKKEDDFFYNSNDAVEVLDSAKIRTDDYWVKHRHKQLSQKENNIQEMVDSLENNRMFTFLKNLVTLAATGYYPIGYVEVGDAFSLVSFNPVERFRIGLALRTSNKFSRRLELGGRLAYGFYDQRFKYGAQIRYNITPKKRGMLSLYYNYDLEQLGQSPTASGVTTTFGSVFNNGPQDKLTFTEKVGFNLEKDLWRDIIVTGGAEWREHTALSRAKFLRPNIQVGIDDTLKKIQTTEFLFRFRWAKNEEFIAGAFDRRSVRSKYPVIAIQGIFGVKDLFGADYNYQKVDLFISHTVKVGLMGRLQYMVNFGRVFGKAAYPFLKVHEGNQSYWLQNNAFNKLNFFEFVSDRYVTVFLEHHLEGLFFNRIPLLKKAKLRTVFSFKATYGYRSNTHNNEMRIPSFIKDFGDTPYAEAGIGIENILKVIRVDLIWRLSHLPEGVQVNNIEAFGIRAKYYINF